MSEQARTVAERIAQMFYVRFHARGVAAITETEAILTAYAAEIREAAAQEALRHAETLEKIADSLVDKPHYVAADFDADFDCREIASWLRAHAVSCQEQP